MKKRITKTKVGGYDDSFVIVWFLIIGLVTMFSYFKCNVFMFVGFESADCRSVDLVGDIHESGSSEGLRATDAKIDVCTENDSVDYADVEEYLDMLRSEITFLDDAIKGSLQKYEQNYSSFFEMNKNSSAFREEKIDDKCFVGGEGDKLVLEITRIHNYIHNKAKILYDLSYN